MAYALFRKGDYGESKRIYLELFEENPDGTAWFPLAMALWRLNDKVEGQQFYERSVTWMDGRRPNDPELSRLRQESAELLGIQP